MERKPEWLHRSSCCDKQSYRNLYYIRVRSFVLNGAPAGAGAACSASVSVQMKASAAPAQKQRSSNRLYLDEG
jgi:hypothetical protein